MPQAVFGFGEFEIDPGRFELRRNGRTIMLERKPLELLLLLVQTDGRLLARDEIARTLWATGVFVDTEHGINTAVRKIRLALRDSAERPRYVQTVTGKGYRFIHAVERTSTLTGTAETNASGAAETDAGNLSQSPAEVPPARWHTGLTLRVAAVAALFITAGLTVRHARQPAGIESVAVLPFQDLSGEPGQQYVVDGVTDELTTALARLTTLHVTSRTSAMRYKQAAAPLKTVAAELRVDALLEGSVSRTGDHAHVTARLIDARTDSLVWAQSYDCSDAELPQLPQRLASTVGTSVHRSPLAQAKLRPVRADAHDAYMHGRYLWFSEKPEAARYFKRAIELQPDYAAAWSGLANFYGAAAVTGVLSPADSLAPEAAAARRSAELDPLLPEAHLSLAATALTSAWDGATAESEIKRATDLDPTFAEAWHFQAKILAALNRHAEAIAAQKRATDLDPFARPWALALSYLEARRYDEALSEALAQREAHPNDGNNTLILANIYQAKGMEAEYAQTLARGLQLLGSAEAANALTAAYRRDGYRGLLLQNIQRLQHGAATHYVSPVRLAKNYAALGNRERTLVLLEQGFRERAPGLLWMQNERLFDSVADDPRFIAIVQGMGLPVVRHAMDAQH